MTDLPYTDADLRAEAARQHAQFTAEPDEGIVGEQMENGYVPSVETTEDGSARTWTELLEPEGEGTPEYVTAQRAVCDLIRRAADVSEWAVNLGADGLEPVQANLNIQNKAGDDRVRLHFAFAPDMDKDKRQAVMKQVAYVIRHYS